MSVWKGGARAAMTVVGALGLLTGARSAASVATRGQVQVVRELSAAPIETAVVRLEPVVVDDTIFGRSGKLRARLVGAIRNPASLRYLSQLLGGDTPARPGIYAARPSATGPMLSFIKLTPFEEKRSGRIGAYRIGFWPAEQGRVRSGAYANPAGFIEVTRENQDTYISEHFRLRDFLTKDQFATWPKYLVLREELVDKLELVIQELHRNGTPVRRMVVMSGFRTPQYNGGGGETSGRSSVSRHMYGDAADVFVDDDGNGRMDDLNRDGRVDPADARVIMNAVERVERRYPELAGGIGIYRANSAHGPFAHVDVRGYRARWGAL